MSEHSNYKCIRDWRRHSKGTIITHWEWRKLPEDIQIKHFEEVAKNEPVQTKQYKVNTTQTLDVNTNVKETRVNTTVNSYTSDFDIDGKEGKNNL